MRQTTTEENLSGDETPSEGASGGRGARGSLQYLPGKKEPSQDTAHPVQFTKKSQGPAYLQPLGTLVAKPEDGDCPSPNRAPRPQGRPGPRTSGTVTTPLPPWLSSSPLLHTSLESQILSFSLLRRKKHAPQPHLSCSALSSVCFRAGLAPLGAEMKKRPCFHLCMILKCCQLFYLTLVTLEVLTKIRFSQYHHVTKSVKIVS